MAGKSDKQSPPKYQQVMEYLMNKIKNGEWEPGDQIPTEMELTKQFGVSRIVVVNSLTRLAAEGVIHRIPGKGSFVSKEPGSPDISGTELSSRIAMIIPNIDTWYTIDLCWDIHYELVKKGYTCSILYSGHDLQHEERLIDEVLSLKYRGLLIYSVKTESYNKKLIELAHAGFPIVLLDHDQPGLDIPCVETDNVIATQIATSHLISLGHHKIGICSQTKNPASSISDRIDGFLEEMKRNNILIDPGNLITDLGFGDSLERLCRVVRSGAATAFVCLNSFDYSLVYKTLSESGLRCPGDASLVSIDAPVLDNILGSNQTTYIRQDAPALALKAVETLFSRMDGATLEQRRIRIPPQLVEGNSTRSLTD